MIHVDHFTVICVASLCFVCLCSMPCVRSCLCLCIIYSWMNAPSVFSSVYSEIQKCIWPYLEMLKIFRKCYKFNRIIPQNLQIVIYFKNKSRFSNNILWMHSCQAHLSSWEWLFYEYIYESRRGGRTTRISW